MLKCNRSGVLLIVALLSACSGSGAPPTGPTQSSTPPTFGMAPANPMPPQALPLGQPLDVTLSANIFQAPMNCEIGGDPAPCAGFTIDTPRAGSLLIEMRFTTTPAPVFMYMYRPVPGNVVDLQNVTSSQSPLLAQSSVGAERIYLHAGLDMPWANSNGQVQFQLLATLQ